jgi:hypothetical protein
MRIQGELKGLGISVSATTVANVLRSADLGPAPRRIGPSWSEFLRAQAESLVSGGLGLWPTALTATLPRRAGRLRIGRPRGWERPTGARRLPSLGRLRNRCQGRATRFSVRREHRRSSGHPIDRMLATDPSNTPALIAQPKAIRANGQSHRRAPPLPTPVMYRIPPAEVLPTPVMYRIRPAEVSRSRPSPRRCMRATAARVSLPHTPSGLASRLGPLRHPENRRHVGCQPCSAPQPLSSRRQ